MSDAKPNYVFPAWWGGQALSVDPPKIRDLLPALRAKVGGLEAKRAAGVRYPIKSAKELMSKLRDALDELGMVAHVVDITGGNIALVDTEGTMAFVRATVRVGAPDGSYVDFQGVGHGADNQDKAGGKASTYAWKDAMVKGLDLPDAPMDDTDDEETPIPSGIRQASGKKADKGAILSAIAAATDSETLKAAVAGVRTLTMQEQAEVRRAFDNRAKALTGTE